MRFLLALTAFVAGCGKERIPHEPIAWYEHMAPACEAAQRENKRVLFFYAADWDVGTKEFEHVSFVDPELRSRIRRDFIPFRFDRTRTYWDEREATRAELAEARRVQDRFHPYGSKYGSLFVFDSTCTHRLADVSTTFDPTKLNAALIAAR